MSSRSALPDQGNDRAGGVFSWPLSASGSGFCSPGCAAILGRQVSDRAAFETLLTPASAARLADALERAEFRLELTLLDGRLIEVTAAREDRDGSARLSGTIEDLTARRGEIAALKAREELCRAVAENSPAMLWMGDQNGKCVFLNQALRDFWGIDPQDLSAFDWTATTHPDDVETLAAPFVRAMAERTPFTVAARYRRADGVYRTLRTQANPRFDRDGTFLGMTGVNTDITDQLVAEERTRMLMGELNHRTKNILSVVQAVARQTARRVSPEDFLRAFEDRLMGLAASNDLLLRSDWTGVELSELVEVQLVHLSDLIGTRLKVDGPALRIAPTAAQTLGMALHELSTNSLKYGALGSARGMVELRWSLLPPGEKGVVAIDWLESGVADVAAPEGKGFGHTVIVDMVAAALDADVTLDFAPGGLKWRAVARSQAGLA
ncbi:MAG: sensor histidine kinase [Mesorhizobium sp.]